MHTSPPTFSGEGLIELDVLEDTKTLTFNLHPTLNITHLAISSSDLKSSSAVQIPVDTLTHDKDQERCIVDLSNLPNGSLRSGSKGVKLWTRFEAELGGSMAGYYKSEGDLSEETGKKPM